VQKWERHVWCQVCEIAPSTPRGTTQNLWWTGTYSLRKLKSLFQPKHLCIALSDCYCRRDWWTTWICFLNVVQKFSNYFGNVSLADHSFQQIQCSQSNTCVLILETIDHQISAFVRKTFRAKNLCSATAFGWIFIMLFSANNPKYFTAHG
jgi:hypothetical protein